MGSAPTIRRPSPPLDRRTKLRRRLLPLVAVALAALVVGVVAGAAHEPAERRVAERFVAAWTRADYGAMYELLDSGSRRRISREAFAAAYRDAAATATLRRVRPVGPLRGDAGGYVVGLSAATETFGTLRGDLRFGVSAGRGAEQPGVAWARPMVFPGLEPGQSLSRTSELPPRGTLEARDGQVIARGADRTGDLGALATEIAGTVGPIPADERAAYAAKGYPRDALVGLSGLERQFESRLAGTFGGELKLGDRVVASAKAVQAPPVRTSIDPDLEAAAVSALDGRYGGIAVLRPATGEVLALAGLAYSAPQPPGSTFKIITLAGSLDAGITKPSDDFPAETETTLEGVSLQNANGESCGGSLAESFAESCNSVFAPLGAKLGAAGLVRAAERFGFNRPTDVIGAPPGAIPAPDEIGDDLAVGSTAIGQGRVTATPLRMAEVTGAIANQGELVAPTFVRGGQGARMRATSAKTAAFVRRAMQQTVQDGTGSGAAVDGVSVAGKTGTAELRTTVRDESTPPGEDGADPDDTTDTTAWFVAFAPAAKPTVAVAVMLIGQGAGGATAAPTAKAVLQAAVG